MYTVNDLLDLTHTLASPLFEGKTYPYEVLGDLKDYILALGPMLPADEYDEVIKDVWVAKDAVIYPNNYFDRPCIIGHRTEVRPGAFIRGSVLVGDDCVVGNSTELKNVILFDKVQVPHYNYVGDSVLGFCAHMGAGSITSNVKADKLPVVIRDSEGNAVETGRKKVGAVLGDHAEIGCNTVLNPGTVIGRNTNVYPLSSVRGEIPADSIYKGKNDIVKKNS